MIVVKLIGGLGNQMFQYAAGRSLAMSLGTELQLDLTSLEKENAGYTKRHFELDQFSIKAEIIKNDALKKYNPAGNRFIIKTKSLFPSFFENLVYNESQSHFHKVFFNLPDGTYLNGYWQDLQYFEKIRPQLCNEFSLKQEPSGYFNELLKEIRQNNSVSIHVRRGDYVSLENANKYHGTLPPEYYQKALAKIPGRRSGTSVFIFSDDIRWCKTNLTFINEPVFVNPDKSRLSSQEELLLMSNCKNNIVANSSFSWWAAWLNNHAEKVVVAPARWFNNDIPQPKNLFPETWLII